MKKTPAVLSLVVVTLLVSIVSANAAETRGNQAVKTDPSLTTTKRVEIEPIRTREELGEMKGELVQERTEAEDYGMQIKYSSQSAKEIMSNTSNKMNVLLEMKDNTKGVTERIKEVAKEQIQSQGKITEKLQKMEEKKIWLKKMLGYDQEAVQSVKAEIEANRDRIAELEALKEETYNKTELAAIDEAIVLLSEQNAILQDAMQAEMQYQGVWGWFRGLFGRS